MASEAAVSSASAPARSNGGLRQRRSGTQPGVPGRSNDNEHAAPSALLQPDDGRSLVAQLWLKSREDRYAAAALRRRGQASHGGEPVLRAQGEDRPVSADNARIAVTLLGLLWYRFLGLFWDGHRVRIGLYLASRIVKGVLPAASAMLDLVQRSFEDKAIPTDEVVRLAVLSLLLSASNDIFSFLSQHNDEVIKNHLDYTMERAYLSAQLSLNIPALSSPYLSSLMYEAGVFAGFEARANATGRSRSGGPYQTLQSTFSLITSAVDVASQAMLLVRTLAMDDLTSSTLLIMALSLAPSLLHFVSRYVSTLARGSRVDWQRMNRDESAIKALGRNGGYKQEVVLFGLADWVLHKWESLKVRHLSAQHAARRQMSGVELGIGIASEGVQTAFYALLATRALATSLSLGSIRLYQTVAEGLIGTVRRMTDVLGSAYQSVFYFAAFCEAVDHAQRARQLDPAKVDYEAIRNVASDARDGGGGGGMRIEAVDLGFTYPGAERPVLRGVNLVVEPGQTLAIVGFNGGGKTTLVKALMGLYDHTGVLRINGVDAGALDPASLHRRTSCLFQDFAKYGLTLRENVGVGDVDRMADDAALQRAIERGGAEAVRDKVGMDGLLNRHGVPDTLGAGDGGGAEEPIGNAGGDAADDMMMPPPGGPPGRGGGPGRGGRGGGGLGLGGRRGQFGSSGRPTGPPPDGMPMGPPPEDLPMGPLPDGMPPPMAGGKRGGKNKWDDSAALSGGQWQRVALSRAFLRADDADLVVFDEPSAALDPKAEAELFQRIHALSLRDGKRRSTTIYISHRFSTVRKADLIAFVEDGTISECGTHTQLMALNGRYAELFNLQKEGFSDN